MKVVCDKCDAIVDDKVKRRFMLWYPFSWVCKTADEFDTEYVLCGNCAKRAKQLMDKFITSD